MKKLTLALIVCSIFLSSTAQPLDAYRIYNKYGEQVDFAALALAAGESRIILFGELHDNPIAHWLQIELTKQLYKHKGERLTLGAEMFETDNRIIIEEYLTGLISQGRFEAEARLWNNYKTDYKPLVEFAKEKGLRFIPTNIPRRYAAMVASGGFEALEKISDEAKGFVAPQPIPYDAELPGYKAMMSIGGMPGKGTPSSDNFPKAQAVKDATMAWNISRELNDGATFIHFHGTYHSNNYEGIVWYINKYKPNLPLCTIATVLQDDPSSLNKENTGIADFVIVVPTTMTRTY